MRKVLENAIDVHVHTAPDLVNRHSSDSEVATDAFEAGMRAVVVKSHVVPTAGRVKLVNELIGEDVLYGGVALNGSIGGINIDAVETALGLGGAIVWLPTAWSANHARQARAAGQSSFVGQRIPGPNEEIDVLEEGDLSPEVQEIIELVGEHDAVLGTGHIRPAAIEAVVEYCAETSTTVLVNHPFFRIVDLPIATQASLAAKGAIMEYCAYAVRSTERHTVERIADAVAEVGVKSCLLATDFGQQGNPPTAGFEVFIKELRDAGLPESEIQQLIGDNPAQLLGLE
jgi:hypothetical protein